MIAVWLVGWWVLRLQRCSFIFWVAKKSPWNYGNPLEIRFGSFQFREPGFQHDQKKQREIYYILKFTQKLLQHWNHKKKTLATLAVMILSASLADADWKSETNEWQIICWWFVKVWLAQRKQARYQIQRHPSHSKKLHPAPGEIEPRRNGKRIATFQERVHEAKNWRNWITPYLTNYPKKKNEFAESTFKKWNSKYVFKQNPTNRPINLRLQLAGCFFWKCVVKKKSTSKSSNNTKGAPVRRTKFKICSTNPGISKKSSFSVGVTCDETQKNILYKLSKLDHFWTQEMWGEKKCAQNLNEGNLNQASLWKAFRVATEKRAKLDRREEISAKRKVNTTKKTLSQGWF